MIVDHAREYSDRGVVDTRMCQLRKFLKAEGVAIHIAYKEGWWLDEADRKRLKAKYVVNASTDGNVTESGLSAGSKRS